MYEDERVQALIRTAREELIEPVKDCSLIQWADVIEKAFKTTLETDGVTIDRHAAVEIENFIFHMSKLIQKENIVSKAVVPESNFYDDFLDCRSYKKKIEILKQNRAKLNDKIISDFAVSLDIVVDEGNTDDRYFNLLSCLNQMSKFESEGLR